MYLTTEEAAKELGVSTRRVRQYIEDGRLKAKKIRRERWYYMIDSQSLAAFHPLPPGRPAGKE